MAIVTGMANIRVNGKIVRSKPGATCDLGGVTREPIMGSTGLDGFSETPRASRVTFSVTDKSNIKLSDIKDVTNGVITFESVSHKGQLGKVYIIRNASCSGEAEVTAGEGDTPFVFFGDEAEELINPES